MLAMLATGRMEKPSAPPVNVAQLSAAILTTSAAASVERMKNGPRSRAQTSVSTAPNAAASTPADPQPDPGREAVVRREDARGVGADAEERRMPE